MSKTSSSPLAAARRLGASIAASTKGTFSLVAVAARERKPSKLASLLKEGSPLEQLIKSLAVPAFWVLLVAPLVLVPFYYMVVSLA